jgi:hypothetical protein
MEAVAWVVLPETVTAQGVGSKYHGTLLAYRTATARIAVVALLHGGRISCRHTKPPRQNFSSTARA